MKLNEARCDCFGVPQPRLSKVDVTQAEQQAFVTWIDLEPGGSNCARLLYVTRLKVLSAQARQIGRIPKAVLSRLLKARNGCRVWQ